MAVSLALFHVELFKTALTDGIFAVKRQGFGTLTASRHEVALFKRVFDELVELDPTLSCLLTVKELLFKTVTEPEVKRDLFDIVLGFEQLLHGVGKTAQVAWRQIGDELIFLQKVQIAFVSSDDKG